jgi:phosphoribosylformylglycinamidine synthase
VDNRNLHWQVPIREVLPEDPIVVPEDLTETEASAAVKLAAFGSSEYAKVVLGSLWGNPPALDLEAEAALHKLLATLAERELLRSARDISDGGIAVSLAQAAFPLGIGATVEQDQSLMVHPLFGLFAEPATTVLVTTHPSNVSTIERLATKHRFLTARIGTTGGLRIEIAVDGEPFISAPLGSLRKPWASALEATLHGEETA